MTYLLDAGVVIALGVGRHEHHARASSWLAGAGTVAVCPVVEGAFVRFLVRTGEPSSSAATSIGLIRALPFVDWWPDDLSYADLDLEWVSGHRQVTDAYLVGLAAARSGVLATLDERLVRAHPHGVLLVT